MLTFSRQVLQVNIQRVQELIVEDRRIASQMGNLLRHAVRLAMRRKLSQKVIVRQDCASVYGRFYDDVISNLEVGSREPSVVHTVQT
jgi:hypothetical protein